ncbi:unnamed protein product [Dibothriocephalus latus]|uniref:Uncharacterized protein n=1 Tax=Dibothriocephalus latus TaxID=60516 RepID=A0A3P7NCB9_DIBLA|nr:unnamed protein product [Dibothriocephalus latus]
MNTVGPYHNLQETYNYFSLPFCKGPQKEIEHYHESLAEALTGVELEFSGLDIRFKRESDKKGFCARCIPLDGHCCCLSEKSCLCARARAGRTAV